MSLALGGQCVRGEKGWEVGVYGTQLTGEGKYWWCGDVKGQGDLEAIVRSTLTIVEFKLMHLNQYVEQMVS